MQLYGLKTCDTCSTALKLLGQVEFFDVRDQGIPVEILMKAYAQFNGALINTRSTTWHRLNESQRKVPPTTLLMEHPTIMKRPLIVDGIQLYLGWNKDVRAAFGIS